ncbi:hypothetical protein GN958_ATG06110 [Phytophthora infestans]|uniref:Uncharacterized protein n=1 Tax=Phytophthora infestans TaxID=4787 RepID=A0A8S9UWA8_PHYIN|nr:hypothetical protein GN958_ATG06110 [Phytophthora infestans]
MKDDEETRDAERAQTYLTTVRPEMALDRFVRVPEVSKDEKTQKSASKRRWSGEGERDHVGNDGTGGVGRRGRRRHTGAKSKTENA